MIGVQGEERGIEPFDMHFADGNAGYIGMIVPVAAASQGEKGQDKEDYAIDAH
jgi:hypothetical protein